MASFYARGRVTASGEPFRPMGMSVALRSYDFGRRYRVTYRGRSVVIVHNDFGPARATGRCADLSLGASNALRLTSAGIGMVTIERE